MIYKWAVTPRSRSSLTVRSGEIMSWPNSSYTRTFHEGSFRLEPALNGWLKLSINLRISMGLDLYCLIELWMRWIGKTGRLYSPICFSRIENAAIFATQEVAVKSTWFIGCTRTIKICKIKKKKQQRRQSR